MSGQDSRNWDDIPTLKLEMDDDYEDRLKSKQSRRHERIEAVALKTILPGNPSRLQIRVGTAAKGVFDGLILDLSESGLRIRIPKALNKEELVKVGFILNDRTIKAKATTRWVDVKEKFCDVGLEFNDLPAEDVEFIGQLTTAAMLSRIGKVR
jgi:hypothetical protein